MIPLLLDLFCKAGGATRGYQQAGFYVIGVDIEPQPNYVGDEFHQADAMTFPLDGFDVIHASPPCHDHSSLNSLSGDNGTGWLLEATLERLRLVGVPYVVENVGRAYMPNNVQLCGSAFGLEVRRHRRFVISPMVTLVPPCSHHLQSEPVDVTGTGGPGGRHRKPKNLGHARAAMGIDWMTRPELSQAIPPAYTEWIGAHLLANLEKAVA